jgi:hypothetical protein
VRVGAVAKSAIESLKKMDNMNFSPRKVSRFTLGEIRRIVARIERPLGHASRVLHRLAHALRMRLPLRLPLISPKSPSSHFDTYLSPEQILVQESRFGALGKSMQMLAMRPMRPLLKMYETSVANPFQKIHQLLERHMQRLLGFGDKMVRFSHRVTRVQRLLQTLDLDTIAKSLEIHP